LPLESRVADLISRLTLSEKIAQMNNAAPAIPRLGIPAYDWWSEALHGIAREGYATVFPQAIAMAASWNPTLLERIGDRVSTEARAKYNATGIGQNHATYNGLTVWSPNINIFRDPRWGRGQETYGEDPVLTAQMGVAYVRGLQGRDRHYLKTAATAKHFAVHSGPEATRHVVNVDVDEQTLHDFYLYAFHALVKDAGVAAVMAAYNALNGTPCAANKPLLTGILREQWGFGGYITSDCGGVWDMVEERHMEPDFAHAAAKALNAGTDLCCGDDYLSLNKALAQGLITEAQIDGALGYLFKTRMRLGMFDPPQRVPYDAISIWKNDTRAGSALSLEMARESMVLLKNDDALPLRRTLRRIAVIGPNGDSIDALTGNYEGTPSTPVTLLQGLRAKLPRAQVEFVQGCDYEKPGDDAAAQRAQALALARGADAVIFAGGITGKIEGEGSGDRTAIELPQIQSDLLQAVHALGKPVILVLMSGSAIASPWAAQHLPAILQAWYPGENGGTAVADVLFGDYNPAGRLPVTFYAATSDLPPFGDYSLQNRTYRYFTGKPLFAFGHGLSYTRFGYSALSAAYVAPANELRVHFTLENTGKRDGDEVAQVYLNRQLAGFARVHLKRGERRALSLTIPGERFARWNSQRRIREVVSGEYELGVGAASDDVRLRQRLTIA
jgi:beta-glucosidase